MSDEATQYLIRLREFMQLGWVATQVDTERQSAAQINHGRMLAAIHQVQPVHSWDDQVEGRDVRCSIRRGDTPIEEGWKEDSFSAAGFTIDSSSRHVNIQRLGTTKKDYPIDGNPLLVFHWGDPLPWSPTRPPMDALAPGTFFFPRIKRHPGIKPWGGSDFVQRAAQAVEMANQQEYFGRMDSLVSRGIGGFR